MDLAQLTAYRATLEAALLTGGPATIQSASQDGGSVTYKTPGQIRNALAEVNRSILRYHQAARGTQAGIKTANFNNTLI